MIGKERDVTAGEEFPFEIAGRYAGAFAMFAGRETETFPDDDLRGRAGAW